MSRELLPLIRVDSKLRAREAAERIRARTEIPPDAVRRAESIVLGVRERGDAALLSYSKELDGVELSEGGLAVGKDEVERAAERVDPGLLGAMRFSLARIRRTQGRLLGRLPFAYVANGYVVRCVVHPLESVGCYVPGGRASYASTVLMTAGVAKLAGVKRVVVCTPPGKDGRVSEAILAAAKISGVDEVYRVGGAQSIAALAYGTESIAKVSKIVGPGGAYVSAAKRAVSSDVPIEFVAGPTEMVVVADSKADPRLVAWDLMGQAEHGGDSICGVVTWDKKLAEKVRETVATVSTTLERRDFVRGCLSRGFAAVCKDRDVAIELVNAIAPEHLELMIEDAGKVARSVENAGLVLAGPYAPAAASDYSIGTDHVLPTGGGARLRAGLTALDFVKVGWVVEGSRQGLKALLPSLRELATAEGLPNHFLSAESRFRKE
ncbi:MAG: histidinol dehydrogenase [Nitrososphaerota archaeon]|nr:histidinol dehydrogenase [Nitrososphaerota archaeon]MDG6966288.1 histidinol dehydrogenase [Nitrososphaerota archaeon]MDG6977723.1 histidinol dehydrogenase [Nitrososphaerota archaeon]